MRCGQPDGILPPTALYNEGWMLRLVLDWAADHPQAIKGLNFEEGSRWYSEALLESRFKPRRKGDSFAEGRTHADGVIGHFKHPDDTHGVIELTPDARQFIVIEAKMASGLSAGTKGAPNYNQAARIIACLAHLLIKSGHDPASLTNCGFVLLAPESRIKEGVFEEANKASIKQAVKNRAESYGGDAVEWYEQKFKPFLETCGVINRSWEEVLSDIRLFDPVVYTELTAFYERCREFNFI